MRMNASLRQSVPEVVSLDVRMRTIILPGHCGSCEQLIRPTDVKKKGGLDLASIV